jgi:hypothetical protein
MLGCIVSECVGHDLEIVIKGVLEVYDSVVEGNGRFVILSNCFNFLNLFLFSTQKTTRDKTFRKRCNRTECTWLSLSSSTFNTTLSVIRQAMEA